ncbi:MAG: LuxR C-terminal-related transcriptional regulator [Chloroflexi bacterium]|nr:LuxR C-terminal-related transcriptional regulator [Chloroflexota bacterium]
MSTTILATKLYIPPPRPKVVLRPRLIERLNEGLYSGCKLTLISASAGFGKTTLVSEWVNNLRFTSDDLRVDSAKESKIVNRVAWLSLDEGDNDPTRFLTYLIAALQTIAQSKVEGVATKLGEGVLGVIQSPQPPPIESILTALINEITTISDNFIFVLDDYHIIDSKPVDNALAFLLEHLPPQMHLVITTREDPDLPLARLRARSQLTELRAADLRFTPAEAAEFLNQAMSLQLSAEDIAALEARTEGWITGLQLAALALQGSLSMQGHPDTSRFIQSFTGSHRFVLDYLVEEVLQRQSELIRSFLLQTSILERLSGPLCDAVTGQKDGRGILETLERGNLFIVPLDDQRQWYRYHHLFTEVLLAHALEEQPGQIPLLHKRASAWYEQNNLPAEAIRHALAARDFEQAARLAEIAWPETFRTYRQNTLFLGWMKALPDEIIHARPVLCAGYAWALQDMGEFENAGRWLSLAENPPSAAVLFVDEAEFQALPGNIAVARAYIAMALGNAPKAEQQARRALSLLPEADLFRRAGAIAIVGMACLQNGNLEGAAKAISEGMEMAVKAGSPDIALSGAFPLVDIRLVQGRLREAVKIFENLLEKTQTPGKPALPGTPDLYLGLCGLLLEQGDTETARQFLQKSEELGESAGLPDWRYRSCLTHARYLEILENLAGALEQINQAERLYMPSALPNLRPPNALKARLRVKQGRLDEALAWAREQSLTTRDDLDFFHEFEHITLARVLIAQHQNDPLAGSIHQAISLLERLLQAAESGRRMGSVIEILVVQALALQAQGNVSQALASMERALALAGPEGYVRIFVDEGEAMRLLIADFRLIIKKLSPQDAHPLRGYVERLLAAFPQPREANPKSKMIEPLSERELEVLRLLGTELSGPEIARELIVSLNTFRTHTKNIFNKLGVNNRRAAVRRAEELDLF